MPAKKDLKNLASLARIELKAQEEEKLLKDLEKIISYFEELKEVAVEETESLAGGTLSNNVFRGDERNEENILPREGAVKQFPENENGFLKVPPVFE